MVVAADEVEGVVVEVEVHGLEGVDTRTMVMVVMEESDGEHMFDVSFACIDSIDCCCSGVLIPFVELGFL